MELAEQERRLLALIRDEAHPSVVNRLLEHLAHLSVEDGAVLWRETEEGGTLLVRRGVVEDGTWPRTTSKSMSRLLDKPS